MEASVVAEKICAWIKAKVEEAGAKGVILGLSGGLDSAVVAALAVRVFPEASLGVIMPCDSLPQDLEDAQLVAQAVGIKTRLVDLSDIYHSLLETLTREEKDINPMAQANIKPRLRMTALHFLGQQRGYLVLGTGNQSELEIGYFTKFGDSGVDLLPIGSLVKSEVRELAGYLGIPRAIIEKPPSAGLWEGQTDEGEMGLTYEELDRYLRTGEGSPEVRARIEHMRRISMHKRQTPPICRL